MRRVGKREVNEVDKLPFCRFSLAVREKVETSRPEARFTKIPSLASVIAALPAICEGSLSRFTNQFILCAASGGTSMTGATHRALIVGRINQGVVMPLGTSFILDATGRCATPHHVVGSNDDNLCVVLSAIADINNYQDLADEDCKVVFAKIVEVDPARDIAILQADMKLSAPFAFPPLGSFDECNVGETMEILGYPHCTHGRRALTLQKAEIGAKVLLTSNGVKSKQGVLNIQTRPGQSGSFVHCPKRNKLVGMLIGAWVPGPTGISLGGINPHELHQTTHCISASHIADML